jgi:DNA-binding SARP family transcriptional activator
MHRLPPRLRVYVCGRLAVEFGPVVVPEAAFPARQGRRLWAFLVLHRQQPVGRADLAEAVWGDAVPDAWDVGLNALASRLRRSLRPLADPCPRLALRGEEGRYALVVPPDTFVDYERAREALHRADVLMRRGELGAALGEARVATEIAARGFLGGEDGDWVEGQRRLLAEVRRHALEYTVEAELARGHPDTAEREAEFLVSLDLARERSLRLLARARQELEAGDRSDTGAAMAGAPSSGSPRLDRPD